MAGGGDDVTLALAATRAGVGRCNESGRGVEEDVVTTATGMLPRGGGADDAKRCHRYKGRQQWVGSSPAAVATPTDEAMPLSPPTDDIDDHDDEGEGRRDKRGAEGGG